MTPVLPFTRAVFAFGAGLTTGTGIALFAVPGRTADYWAWEIKSPLTAAMFGAGYIGAATSLLLAVRAREWPRARVVAIVALALTSLALLTTLLHLDEFAFGDGGLTGLVAVVWLVVYLALPPLVLTAFVIQERAGGRHEYLPGTPALLATRLALGATGAALGALGIGLVTGWPWLAEQWPWPLPALPGGVAGAWVCTFAAGLLWFAVCERDWSRVRAGVAPAILVVVLNAIAAARFWDRFDSDTAATVYAVILGLLFAVLGGAAVIEERRLTARPGSRTTR
jgi:hypothetical protein